jgi:hypothetical protein
MPTQSDAEKVLALFIKSIQAQALVKQEIISRKTGLKKAR